MRRWMTAMALVMSLLAAACGGDDGEDEATTTPGDDEETTTTAAEAGSEATVELADSPFGEILVDAEGRTLYLFTRDTDGESVCEGDCAQQWPPLGSPEEPVAGAGVDEALLGTTTRPDGTEQVTYADHPLYHFANDEGPGDTNGQGVGGVWFVVGPDGEAITEDEEAAAAAADSGSGSDSYGPVAAAPTTAAAASAAPTTRAPAPASTRAAPTTAPPTTAAPTTAAPATSAPTTAAPTTTPTTAAPATARITIADFAYSPAALRVAPGTRVTATNNDGATHTWTSSTGGWDSGDLDRGESASHTFTEPGTFAYFCAIHPSMRGSVTVT